MLQHIIKEIEASLNTRRYLQRIANDIQRKELASEQLAKSLQKQQELASNINRQIQAYRGALDSLRFPTKAYQQALASRQFAENFLEHRLRTIEMIRESIEDLPEREKKGLQTLAEEGWFFDPEMPCTFLQKIEVLLKKYPKEFLSQLNDYCVDHFREQLDNIEKKLTTSYPHRSHLLLQAFSAHRCGEYSLSIKAFLPEADGIFSELFPEKSLFRYEQRKSAINKYASKTRSHFLKKYFHLFLLNLPLWMSKPERDGSSSALNRHRVLHGKALDDYTEENSLKTISLLCFIRYLGLYN